MEGGKRNETYQFTLMCSHLRFSIEKAANNAPSLWKFRKTVLSGLARAQHCLLRFFNKAPYLPLSLSLSLGSMHCIFILFSLKYSLTMPVEGGGGLFFYLQNVNIVLWWRTICSYCVSRLDRHVTYYTSHMCTYVDTRLSLPSLKYTVVAWLLTCLHLSTSGVRLYTRPQPHNTLLAPTCTFFEYKTKHVERQRVLPAFAHDCSRLLGHTPL
jgi:hypothetical protein